MWVILYASYCLVCVTQITCLTYEEQLDAKKTQVQGMQEQIKKLAVALKSAKEDTSIATALAKLKSDLDANLKVMVDSNEKLREELKKEVESKISASKDILQDYATNKVADEKYSRFTYLVNAMKVFKEKYEKGSKWLNDKLKKNKENIEKKAKDFEAVQTGLQTVFDALSGDMNEQEKKARLEKINELQNDFYLLTKQVQGDSFHEEEKQRSDGNSGIKQIRAIQTGAKNYHSNTHTGRTFSSIHEHSNNIRTVGMGEFIGVLNGVEFRTRHNDYRLKQAVTNNKKYHATEDVKFPDVPQAVKDAGSVEKQAAEMREWFKAFHEQDYSVRDYRKYFKPLLVYLEGAWTLGGAGDKIDEPFESDRHHIDASSWLDLQEKVRFTSYTGSKSLLENLAHLPTKIIRFTEDRKPVLAQWNYRLMCHPIDADVPTKFLKLVPDPAAQQRRKINTDSYAKSRAAKFELEGIINSKGKRKDGPLRYSFLDEIMEEVPGKDNYGSHIEASPFNAPDHVLHSANPKKNEKLNAAYYSRAFVQYDSNGERVYEGQRGFSDRLYMAHTTQERVAHMSYNATVDGKPKMIHTKVSYAIPVEIIYLTPLHSWNPYNIPYGKLDGTGSKDDPFKEIDSRNYYMTPDLFFSGEQTDIDPADTSKTKGVIVQSSDGKNHIAHASGTRIFFPTIKGIDAKIRQRYPIMPVFGEGSSVWKKLNSIEDMLSIHNPIQNENMYFSTGLSHSEHTTGHQHIVEISREDYEKLIDGDIQSLKITAERANGHTHELTIGVKNGEEGKVVFIKKCDSADSENTDANEVCFDNHTNTLAR